MKKLPVICLTFDLEEFDLPVEYKQEISEKQQMEVTQKGMDVLLPMLDQFDVHSTFFTTANFAQHKQDLIRSLIAKHEIASHSFFHSSFENKDLANSRKALEEITGAPVIGFRMPRMQKVDHQLLIQAGYKYDSSLHPTWIPGRYNHFSKPATIFKENGLVIFPASVTPNFRSPLFWLSFKNFSSAKYCRLVQKCLDAYGYANIYLHPWEFADLSAFKLPKYIAKDQKQMSAKLQYLLSHFSGKARFSTIQNFLTERNDL